MSAAVNDGADREATSTRRIVICADGTGNRGGLGRDTNVWRVYKAASGKEDRHQFALYDDGVGTEDNRLQRLRGRAFGLGLSANIRELYLALCNVYEPGADIYLFGFSRGAHTVRALAGFITSQGILNPGLYASDEALAFDVWLLFDAYRAAARAREHGEARGDGTSRWPWLTSPIRTPREFRGMPSEALYRRASRDEVLRAELLDKARSCRRSTDDIDWAARGYSAGIVDAISADVSDAGEATGPSSDQGERFRVPIRFMGLWDTVDAVGFPLDWIADYWDTFVYRFRFRNYRLSPLIHRACHALAIDDARQAFRPRLIDVRGEGVAGSGAAATATPPRVRQIWYSGSHSNVGGGYPKQGLAHVSLGWIAAEATAEGLLLEPTPLGHAGVRSGAPPVEGSSADDAAPAPFALYASETNAHDKLYNSRAGLASLYAYRPRDVAALHDAAHVVDDAPANETTDQATGAEIDRSVFERIDRRTFAYSPWNLPPQPLVTDGAGEAARAAAIVERWRTSSEERRAELASIGARAKKQAALQTNVKIFTGGALYAALVGCAVDLYGPRTLIVLVAILAAVAWIAHTRIETGFGREIARRGSGVWWPLVFPGEKEAGATNEAPSVRRGALAGLAREYPVGSRLALAIGLLGGWALIDSALWPALLLVVAVDAGGRLSNALAGFREREYRPVAKRELQLRKLGYDAREARTYLEALLRQPAGTTPPTSAAAPATPEDESESRTLTALDDYRRALRVDYASVLIYLAALCVFVVTSLGLNDPWVFPVALIVAYAVAEVMENGLLLRAVDAKLAEDGCSGRRPLSPTRLDETLLAASFWTVVKFWTVPAILIFVVLAAAADTVEPVEPAPAASASAVIDTR